MTAQDHAIIIAMRRAEADLRAGTMERHCRARLAEALAIVGAVRAARERQVCCARCGHRANDLQGLERHALRTHGVGLDGAPINATKEE